MKKILFFFCFNIIFISLFSNELIHAYYGDFKEVIRIVFVLKSETHYSTLMDTDNKMLYIHISNTQKSDSLLPLSFDNNFLVNQIQFESLDKDLKISIFTNIVYYAESFFLVDDHFKVVIDLFRQKEPSNLDMAKDYLNFYNTVGYSERARLIKNLINNNKFSEPFYSDADNFVSTTITPEKKIEEPEYFSNRQRNTAPFNYIKPDIAYLNQNQKAWINESFMLYESFKNIHLSIEKARENIYLYDSKKSVDIKFIESMSKSYNSLSDINIRINEIRLNLMSLKKNINFERNESIDYTQDMIDSILVVLTLYQNNVIDLQSEFNKRINR